ncbi:60S ribosomal protein L19-like [Schistocerca gregaria]|uniref:60S ribosomal protein L19-like n=1 Tax=Schistocerca gregaria TaxID=7010 RepID=UPI00211F403E|nr:60S ribosomal protein L19-like [Schistocerca gregaria]
MVSLKLQRRLAASVLRCGKNRVWLDPNEISEISLANSRASIRKLYRNGLIIKQPVVIRSRERIRKRHEARCRGRHRGLGRRHGTANARMPEKLVWMRRIRVLRRLLKKFRAQKKIDKHVYHNFYMKVKGNVFKNKRLLIEGIYKFKEDSLKLKTLEEQAKVVTKRSKEIRENRIKKQEVTAELIQKAKKVISDQGDNQ